MQRFLLEHLIVIICGAVWGIFLAAHPLSWALVLFGVFVLIVIAILETHHNPSGLPGDEK